MRAVSRDKRKGSVLILTLMLMVTSAIFTTVYLAMINSHTAIYNSRSDGVRAFYVAEAGLHQAVWYLINTAPDGTTDGSWRTTGYPEAAGENPNDPQQESFAEGDYTMWVEDSGGAILITSRGIYNGVTRIVHELEILDNSGSPNTLDAVAGSWGID